MRFVKKAPLIFYLLFFVSIYVHAENHSDNLFSIDTIQTEYGSLVNHMEFFLDTEASKSLDDFLEPGLINFQPMNDKKKIYRNFQQLSAKPTVGEGTTGLGLSIVKKFVDAMDGDLKLKSEGERGACFIIEFEKK